jgi:hypothetical protein
MHFFMSLPFILPSLFRPLMDLHHERDMFFILGFYPLFSHPSLLSSLKITYYGFYAEVINMIFDFFLQQIYDILKDNINYCLIAIEIKVLNDSNKQIPYAYGDRDFRYRMNIFGKK